MAQILPLCYQTYYTMIYISLFTLLVAAIALVTNQLNKKPLCNHNWESHDNSFKCCNCGKKIPDLTPAYDNAYAESFQEAA